MAEGVVIRFKADSAEYDAKLKRSIEQMQQMENQAKKLNGTIDRTDESYVKFVQSIGSMETQANSAKGKINEMTKAFIELSLQYKKLTDTEKNSPFGKALSSSLDQLKTRIKDSKSELAGIEKELVSFGDVATQLGAKLGLPIGELLKFGPAVAAVGAAVFAAGKVIGDAFKQNEVLMDDWGQTTRSASALYDGFLNSLNNGGISGYLQNINNIVNAAKNAYDALDELGTFNAFNQINTQKAQTGFTEAITNFREGSGSLDDVKTAAETFKTELSNRMQKENDAYVAAIKELAAKRGVDADLLQKALTGSYGDFDTLKKQTAIPTKSVYNSSTRSFYEEKDYSKATDEQKLGEALRQLTDEELENLQALGAQAEKTNTEIAQIDKQVARAIVSDRSQKKADARDAATAAAKEAKPQEDAEKKVAKALEDYANTISIAKIRFEEGLDDEEKYKNNLLSAHERLFTAYSEASTMYEDPAYAEAIKNEVAEIKSLSQAVKELKDAKEAQKQADRELEQAEREKTRQIKQLDTTILSGLTNTAKKAGWTAADLGTTGIKTQIDAGVDISEDTWKEFEAKLNERLKELHMDPIQINFETGNIEQPLAAAKKDMAALTENVQGAIGVFGQLGGAMQQLDDPSAKVAGIIMGAIAEVAGTFAASLKGTFTPWDWISASIAGVSTMISTIAAIKSATSGSYASGGIIPGNSFSGDNLTANVNSGELILNRAQQGSIAGQLQGNPMGNLRLSTEISGTNLRVVLNNDNRSKGGDRNFYSKIH